MCRFTVSFQWRVSMGKVAFFWLRTRLMSERRPDAAGRAPRRARRRARLFTPAPGGGRPRQRRAFILPRTGRKRFGGVVDDEPAAAAAAESRRTGTGQKRVGLSVASAPSVKSCETAGTACGSCPVPTARLVPSSPRENLLYRRIFYS